MVFPPLGNSDHVIFSVSVDFPSNSKSDVPLHHIVHDYSCPDLDGLCHHFRDVPWEEIFKLSVSAAASEFYKWVKVEIDVSLIVSIRSSLTHLHGFKLLVLVP